MNHRLCRYGYLFTIDGLGQGWGIFIIIVGFPLVAPFLAVGLYEVSWEIDFISAMITSVSFVAQNRLVMLVWGLMVAGLTIVAMLPSFLGLLVVLPVLGHATWHLYRIAVE